MPCNKSFHLSKSSPARILKLGVLSLLFASTVGMTGCTATIKDTGFLAGGYTTAAPVDEKDFKLRLSPDILAVGPAAEGHGDGREESFPIVFIVEAPVWDAPDFWPGKPEKIESLLFTIRERTYRYLLRNYPEPTKVRYALPSNDILFDNFRPIVVTTRVTDANPGHGWKRYLVAMTFGAVELQLEGELFTDVKKTEKIGEFAVRKHHAGYAQSGFNPAVLKSDYCMKYASDEAILDLTEALGLYLPDPMAEITP